MHSSSPPPTRAASTLGARLIALGLAILLAATYFDSAPVVTAAALLMLGATLATFAKFAGRPTLQPVAVLNLFVYGNLYLLFVGAVCFGEQSTPPTPIAWPAYIDLAASILPAALALRISLAALMGYAAARQ